LKRSSYLPKTYKRFFYEKTLLFYLFKITMVDSIRDDHRGVFNH